MSTSESIPRQASKSAPAGSSNGPPARLVSFSQLAVGQFATCERTVRDSDITAFSHLLHDNNPLHLDTAFARNCGFDNRVAHGMLPLSMISCLIGTQLPGPGALWISQQVEFVNPVMLNNRLEARVTIESMSAATRVVTLSTEVVQTNNHVTVLRGVARVRVPSADAREEGRRK